MTLLEDKAGWWQILIDIVKHKLEKINNENE